MKSLLPLAVLERNRESCLIILLVFLCILSFANIFSNHFVWDDQSFIIADAYSKRFANIPGYFLTDVRGIYRPLRTVAYAFHFYFWQYNPVGYHLNSLFLHSLSTILLYLLARSLHLKRGVALLAGSIFALHPLHTEAVTFMTAGFDLYGMVTFLTSLLLYITSYRASSGRRRGYLTASVLLYGASLFFSEMAVTAILLVILYDSCYFGIRSLLNKSLRYLSFFTVMAAYLSIRFVALGIGVRETVYLGGNLLSQALTICYVFITYLRLFLFPFNLKIEYSDFPIIESISDPRSMVTFVFLLAAIFLLVKRTFAPFTRFSLLWMVLTFLPVSNIIPTGTVLAERYGYLISGGGCLLAGQAVYTLLCAVKRTNRTHLYNLSLVIVTFFVLGSTLGTISRNTDWTDEYSLFSKSTRQSPGVPDIHNNLGLVYYRQGDHEAAIKEFETGLKTAPDDVKIHNNLGIVYLEQSRFERALSQFEKALEILPNYAPATLNVARTYAQQGDRERAIQEYLRILELDNANVTACLALGRIYMDGGMYAEAAPLLEQCIAINPYMSDVYALLGKAYLKSEMPDQAIDIFTRLLKLSPHNLNVRYELASLYHSQGALDKAERAFRDIVEEDPEHYKAHYYLGLILQTMNRYYDALEHFSRAAELQPALQQKVCFYEGNIYFALQDYQMAIERYKQAPRSSEARNNLGLVYKELGRYQEAIHEWEEALKLDPEMDSARNNIERLRQELLPRTTETTR